MVPDETSDLPTTLPEASFLNPNRKVPSEARSLRGLFPVPVFAEFPSYSLSKNADGFLQNPFWLSYCNLRKLKQKFSPIADKNANSYSFHSVFTPPYQTPPAPSSSDPAQKGFFPYFYKRQAAPCDAFILYEEM